MKRLALCFDGTWNTPADDSIRDANQVETNVRRFFEAVVPVASDGVRQLAWYNAGVGTEWYNKLTGGAFGALLDQHILDGYRYLVDHYEDGDEVFIVGFSRGAYAARSLVGMIRNCGLVKPGFGVLKIATAYGIYRTRKDPVDSETAQAFKALFARDIAVRFLGVWDTVGALGIPLHVVDRFNAGLYQFHDTRLSSIVESAYHAVAVDEHRRDYDACLWNPQSRSSQTLEQRWFCGAHCDVGGGYPQRKLSDLSLRWMQDRAESAGLQLNKAAVADDNCLGLLTDSYAEFLRGKYAKLKRRFLRPISGTRFGNETVDESVAIRKRATKLVPRYLPRNRGL